MRRGQQRGQPADPIVRWEPGGDDGDMLLMDTTALMLHLGIGGRTVRRYEAVACDVHTHAPLWDAVDVGTRRATVRTRAPRAVSG